MNTYKFLTATALAFSTYSMAAAIRIEAEDAVPADDHKIETLTDAKASGGKYVEMADGDLAFTVNMPSDGYYTLYVSYKLPTDRGSKTQNLTLNGSSAGQVTFGVSDDFKVLKAAGKIKLKKGENAIGIVHSWGWVAVDYIEISEYEATPWNISPKPVTPEPTESAQKLYNFLYSNFGKRTISGVMTERPFENNGQYTPQDFDTQTELSYINKASGKNVVLVGFDFLHSSGKSSDQQWYQGYTHASLEMAKTVWKKGGIPQFNWHWKDPMHTVEAFYTQSSGNDPYTEFSIGLAYDTTTGKWKTDSDEYKALMRDMEMIADSLLTLQKEGVAVLWRPLHEASGKWFWWGTDGAKPCVALYKLMFDTFVNKKGLHNLIWVWTTDEAPDALDWYPGDEYVDVVGRDYYYYPREANHASLVSSFEKVKEMYGAKKIVTLSENGSVPYPDEMKADGANWSWFMPWYGDYAMEGWANDNNAESWKTVMNNDYIITLEDMPGWDKYEMQPTAIATSKKAAPAIRLVGHDLQVNLNASTAQISIYDLQGNRVLAKKMSQNGTIALSRLARGPYLVKIQANGLTQSLKITLK
ncbi:glycosyl hydrolase [Fibrobacter sp. UWB5]|uniref:glycosyl hydrolase n=1 Tax=Fibrobacter sp. UWB5 TaxID=1964360 RepID=UPI000B520317|nr:glycosyl hydrolase [Fibrobacter sp. UWB5]OWV14538.1 beta-mannosidase [Fibrobacter sp. UWB5]